MSKAESIARVAISYVVGLGLGALWLFLGPDTGHLWLDGLVLVGAVAMLAMFLGASIAMMEKRSLARRPQYQQVVDRVSLFVPRPPRRDKATV